ncbi:hypothetical protein GH714_040350 [Hevea brasiliensis]|uniref:HAT C-terminal dimerisation domain-containing protein n=1 Tax=Hevea brasiliensis TaxID=3981 RepID=A0A6A6MPW1_HEVBR|nr:hypothetical protein GH714_040350 [Hevea brasiliensis]
MEFALSTVYGKEKGMELAKKIKLTVYELFDEYKKTYQAEHERGSNVAGNTGENNESEGAKKKSRLNLGDQFLKHKIETGEANSKSDLDCYLNEGIKVVDEKEEFILKWWQLSSGRFPILSIMVRDILAMPISTVASESAFSTRGRVLDPFRSSLTPKIVEALICAQDWLRKSHCCKSIEEQIVDLERLEEGLLVGDKVMELLYAHLLPRDDEAFEPYKVFSSKQLDEPNKIGKINLAATGKDLMDDDKQGDMTIELFDAFDMETEAVSERYHAHIPFDHLSSPNPVAHVQICDAFSRTLVDLTKEPFQMLATIGPYLYRDTILLQKVKASGKQSIPAGSIKTPKQDLEKKTPNLEKQSAELLALCPVTKISLLIC